jgi:hypothetical protein
MKVKAPKKFVSINGQTVRKRGDNPIRIARTPSDQKPEYANEVDILDVWGNVAARLVYDPGKKIMRCGARLVLECPHGLRKTR